MKELGEERVERRASQRETIQPIDRSHVVVLVDSDPSQVDLLGVELEAYGYNPVIAASTAVANHLGSTVAAVVLGSGLVPVEAFDLCHRVSRYTDAPLIVLMNGRGPRQMGLALEAGADHCFVVESHDAAPLIVSALHAVERRVGIALRQERTHVTVGQIQLDVDRRTAEFHGAPVPLTTTEFNILVLLAQRAGKVMSAVEILDQLQDEPVGEHEARDIVKVHVSRLRQKLEVDPSAAQALVNVRGQGYVLDRRGKARGVANGARSGDAMSAVVGEAQPV